MGLYGRNYTYTVGDYFKTINFKAHGPQNTVDFPTTLSLPVLGQSGQTLTATRPAQGVNIGAGNKWIQFVVSTEGDDMNGTGKTGHGVTIYHKPADGTVTEQVINFNDAVLKESTSPDAEPLKDSVGNLILGYGKAVRVNNLEFDEAGHAKGSELGIVGYALPPVLDKQKEHYEAAKEMAIRMHDINDVTAETELKALVRNYPFSAELVIKPLADHELQLIELNSTVYGDQSANEIGLVDRTTNLESHVEKIDDQIDNTILPALNLKAGIAKPGIEFNKIPKENNPLGYKSPLTDIKYLVGPRGTVFNYYALDSLEKYSEDPVDFTKVEYKPGQFYRKEGKNNYVLATELTPLTTPGVTYHTKEEGSTFDKTTNYVFGSYALAEGCGTRAFGNYSHAENGYAVWANANDVSSYYPTTAYGASSHAEGHSDMSMKPLQIKFGENSQTNLSQRKIHTTSDLNSYWSTENYRSRRTKTTMFVGLDVETSSGVQAYKIYPATLNNNVLNIETGSDIINDNLQTYELYSSLAYGEASHIEGQGTIAGGKFSHAEGNVSLALGQSSHAEGECSIASKKGAHAEGYQTNANGEYSHAEGSETTADGEASHAEGISSIAGGKGAHAEGIKTNASGLGSHAEGANYESDQTEATGIAAHAEGGGCVASGNYSHAEGVKDGSARVEARGLGSHAQGGGCVAIGNYSHAGGQQSQAHAYASFASGVYVNAWKDSSAAMGKYNRLFEVGQGPLFTIGNGVGTDEGSRKDAFNIWESGNCFIYGSLGIVGGGSDNSASALYLKDANGKYWKFTVDTSGQLVPTKVEAEEIPDYPIPKKQ